MKAPTLAEERWLILQPLSARGKEQRQKQEKSEGREVKKNGKMQNRVGGEEEIKGGAWVPSAGVEGGGQVLRVQGWGRGRAGLTGPQGRTSGTGSSVGRQVEGASTERRQYSTRKARPARLPERWEEGCRET